MTANLRERAAELRRQAAELEQQADALSRRVVELRQEFGVRVCCTDCLGQGRYGADDGGESWDGAFPSWATCDTCNGHGWLWAVRDLRGEEALGGVLSEEDFGLVAGPHHFPVESRTPVRPPPPPPARR